MRDIVAIGTGDYGEFREHLFEKETDKPLTEEDLRNIRAQATRRALDWREAETEMKGDQEVFPGNTYESMRGKEFRVLKGTTELAPELGELIIQRTHDILEEMGYHEAHYPYVYVDEWNPDDATVAAYLKGEDI